MKLTTEELEKLDCAIEEMNIREKDKKTIEIEKGMKYLLDKKEELDNEILEYQFKHNMSGPYNLQALRKIFDYGFSEGESYMGSQFNEAMQYEMGRI